MGFSSIISEISKSLLSLQSSSQFECHCDSSQKPSLDLGITIYNYQKYLKQKEINISVKKGHPTQTRLLEKGTNPSSHHLSPPQLLCPCNHTMNGCLPMVQVDQRTTLAHPKTIQSLGTARGEHRAQAAEGKPGIGTPFPASMAVVLSSNRNELTGTQLNEESAVSLLFTHPL